MMPISYELHYNIRPWGGAWDLISNFQYNFAINIMTDNSASGVNTL